MSIDYEGLKPYIYNYIEDMGITIRSNNTLSECPVCHGGQRTHNSSIDKNKNAFKCFACDFYGDIIDLCMRVEGIVDRKEAARQLAERYQGKQAHIKKNTTTINYTAQDMPLDYSDYIEKCAAEPHAPDYFLSRGLSLEVVKKFKLGLDTVKQQAIIPYNNGLYIGRDITGRAYAKYERAKGAVKTAPYNAHRLNEDTTAPLWVVEGEINALSLETLSLQAVGLGSTSDWRILIDYISRYGTKRPLIVCLDNDEKGKVAQDEIAKALASKNIRFKSVPFPLKGMDINDALVKDRERLLKYMVMVQQQIEQQFNNELQTPPLFEYNGIAALDSLLKRVQNPDFKPIPTGFKVLDKKLGGGLYSGLALIAAAPSEGKTTFAMQIGENIAEREERDLLVFSFEMSREQLTAKTISRLTYENSNQNPNAALTAIEFMQSFKPDCRLDGAKLVSRVPAIDRYTDKIGKYIHIFDDCEPTTAGIMARIEEWERVQPIKKKAPIILVDYLQLLDSGDKEFISGCKDITLALKQYAIAKDTIVFAISAVNRDSQRNGTTLTSAYGSSFAEYSSDYMFTLDFTAIKKKFGEETKEQLKQKPIREMTVTIQKNRMGMTGEMIDFRYAAGYNHFTDTLTEAQLAETIRNISERKERGGAIR